MTNSELKEALRKEITMPHEELQYAHPTVDDFQTEFIDYTPEGKLILGYPIKLPQRNGYRQLQGGLIAAFFDNNYGIYGYMATGGKPLPTINLTINYHKGVMEDTDKVIVTTWIVSAGKRILSVAGEAHKPDGQLIATCQANILNAEGVRISI